MSITNGFELIDSAPYAEQGPPHDTWTKLRALALRFLLTLLISPGPKRSEAELRAFLWRRLVPALGLRKS